MHTIKQDVKLLMSVLSDAVKKLLCFIEMHVMLIFITNSDPSVSGEFPF